MAPIYILKENDPQHSGSIVR